MEKLPNLTPEQIDILLEECARELKEAKKAFTLLTIEKNSLKSRIRRWEEEKELLELLKAGSSFDEPLTSVKSDTLRSLQDRYERVMNQYDRYNKDEDWS